MPNNELQTLETSRNDFFTEHKETTKYVAKLALTSKKSSLTFKFKLVKLYKIIFRIK
jgi:hypothetical protein